MATRDPLPRTLIEAIRYFADPANCLSYLVSRRWPNGVTCPTAKPDPLRKTAVFERRIDGYVA